MNFNHRDYIEKIIFDMAKFLSDTEMEEFMAVFPKLLEDILDVPEFKGNPDCRQNVAFALIYNVPHGKRLRSQAFLYAYKCVQKKWNSEDRELAYIMAWCIEFWFTAYLVIDDIVDAAEIRREKTCWYRLENIGIAAFPDACVIRTCVNVIVRKYFKNKRYYCRLLEIFNEVDLKTGYGQNLDTRVPLERQFSGYTMELFDKISKYKTSYFCYYCPIALALAMAGRDYVSEMNECAEVVLRIGKFLQVSNDYFEVYHDFSITRKIGTDIEEGKCAWVVVTAIENATPQDLDVINNNYGKKDPGSVRACKELFDRMEIPKKYLEHERQTFLEIHSLIDNLPSHLPKSLFRFMIEAIHHLDDYSEILQAGLRRDAERGHFSAATAVKGRNGLKRP